MASSERNIIDGTILRKYAFQCIYYVSYNGPHKKDTTILQLPVPALKEQIASVTGVVSEHQRLICRGKVLKDDQLLSAYRIPIYISLFETYDSYTSCYYPDALECFPCNWQPFHPSSSSSAGGVGPETATDHPVLKIDFSVTDPSSNAARNRGNHVAHSVVLGTFNIADQGEGSMPDMNRFVSALLSSVGISNLGIGGEGADLRDHGLESGDRTAGASGTSATTQGPPGSVPSQAQSDPLHSAFRFPSAVSFGPVQPTAGTLSMAWTLLARLAWKVGILRRVCQHQHPWQKLCFLQDKCLPNKPQNAYLGGGDDDDDDDDEVVMIQPTLLLALVTNQRHFHMAWAHCFGYPTVQWIPEGQTIGDVGVCFGLTWKCEGTPEARPAKTLRRVGALIDGSIRGAAIPSMWQLARQLEDQASVTDPLLRAGIQSSTIRSGILMQNLGALLLELGRTTMTLRMGRTPAEAIVNAGPAVYISTSGPNPLMVQPLPFQPGTSFGSIPSGALQSANGLTGGILGSGVIPRNIDIRIRAGRSVPTPNANQGDQAGTQQPPGQQGQTNSAGANVLHQTVSGGSSFTVESGVRVVPVRTVVAAVPAALRRPPSDAAGSSVGLFYPLLARVQHLNSGQSSDTRGPQPSVGTHPTGPGSQQPIPEAAAVHQQNLGPHAATARGNGSVLNSNLSEGESSGNNIHNTQPNNVQQNSRESMPQIPSRFDQLLRTIFSGDQIHVSDINFQGTGGHPITEQRESTRDAYMNSGSGVDIDQGVFFSGLVRQIMPFISQATAMEMENAPSTSAGGSAPDSSTSQEDAGKPKPLRRRRGKVHLTLRTHILAILLVHLIPNGRRLFSLII
ncbi:hypothetical protein ACLOJK_002525 [Asimina triloba]